MKEMCLPNKHMPSNYSQWKKIVKDVGNNVIHIDCYRKGHMPFFKEDSTLDSLQALWAFKMEEANIK